jgi:hypothetical protein
MISTAFKIPKSWDDVSISKGIEFFMIDRDNNNIDEIIAEEITILTDIPYDKVMAMPIQSINELMEKLSFRNKTPDKSLKVITVDGIEYGLVNNKQLSFGEFVDLDSFIKEEGFLSNMPKMLSIMYREIIKWDRFDKEVYYLEDYNPTTQLNRYKLFEEKLMMGDVYASVLFFCSIAKQYSNPTQLSLLNLTVNLVKDLKELEMKMIHTSQNDNENEEKEID